MAYKVFIDGAEGTTGLKIHERLAVHGQVDVITIPPELRKDSGARRQMIHESDVTFLCLPDAAAREAVALAEGSAAIIIDASTAHRTQEGWAYGLPELSNGHREKVASSNRICVPGCHATGFISIVYPLIASGMMDSDYPASAHSITGYSGGGKKMIAEYEAEDRDVAFDSPRQYGLTLSHKHLPEMTAVTGLSSPPVFNPIVCDFYAGMAVSVPLHMRTLLKQVTLDEIKDMYADFYAGANFISLSGAPDSGFLPANGNTGTNNLTIYVLGNDNMATIVSVFDNLGKGASGAAVQNMNIALGIDERTGLI